jgi:mono/diheme cytochrome c family protein
MDDNPQTFSQLLLLLLLLFSSLVLLAACSEEAVSPAPAPGARNSVSAERLAGGQQLYQQNCAVCHGEQGVGAPNWRQRDANGQFPPPPLNGSAHTWHHPWAQLHHKIKNGGPAGQSTMPAWKDELSDQQIDDIILWFQSLWPDEVYATWYKMDQDARARTR